MQDLTGRWRNYGESRAETDAV